MRKANRKIDCGMIWHVEEEDLRGAHEQSALDTRRIRRKTTFKHRCEQMAQCAQSPQYGRDEAAHKRAIAVGEFAQRTLILELFVERTFAMENAFENIRDDAADGEAGNGRRHDALEGSCFPAYTEFN